MIDMSEAYANIQMPPCPECGEQPFEARLQRGRTWQRGPEMEPTADLSCGHQLTGDAARTFRQGIPDMYKIEP